MKKAGNPHTRDKPDQDGIKQRLIASAEAAPDGAIAMLKTSYEGLTAKEAEAQRQAFGTNRVFHEKKKSVLKIIAGALFDPFTAILFLLALVSLITDVILPSPGSKNPVTVIIICSIILVSGLIRFVQEIRSGNAAERLNQMVKTTITVQRKGRQPGEIPLEDAVVGDIIHLSAGDMVPADVRILKSKDLFVDQSSLTGESDHLEKIPGAVKSGDYKTLTDYPNLAFMGSNVVSGSAVCVAVVTGGGTMFGSIAKNLEAPPVKTGFDKGLNSVSWTFIRFMLVMVPVIFFINGIHSKNWIDAFLFAISVAVGLTPEMLPMIVTSCLAKGAVAMSKKKTIIKKLNSIQNFGAMDILCTDKTGTLTQNKVVLQYHLDIHGNESREVLDYAFINSYYQSGLKNLMDHAIINRTQREEKSRKTPPLSGLYEKVDEVPFDFERRRMSVVVAGKDGGTQMITKGAVEEMLRVCSYADDNGKRVPLDSGITGEITGKVDRLNRDGMRVIAVARKTDHSPVGSFSVNDEKDMTFLGCLAFLDPPKETAKSAISALCDYGVGVKILTGDNEQVTRWVCGQTGIEANEVLLGSDIERMDDAALKKAVEDHNVFSKLSPGQKARIVKTLRENGHTVGYMGDGFNDAPALKEADVGISVDTAVDIARESAGVILLKKDLMVLKNGITEGRKTYANMIKYIKMTASSNFGNVLSVLLASIFLPFLPMAPIHLLLLNLIYDISCSSIPWDNVDEEFLKVPRSWDSSSVGRFMLWMGPVSSVFDITTFLLMYFLICPALSGGQYYSQITDPDMKNHFISLFRSGWFVESMWTQTLVIHMIRTPKIPFIQSRASYQVTGLTAAGMLILTAIPFTPFGAALGLAPLPGNYFIWLGLTVLAYMILATLMKNLYVKRCGNLL